jgi:hypothetical protein
VFAIKYPLKINNNFSVLVNGTKIDYEFKRGLLHFPIETNKNKIVEIVFKFKEIQSPFEEKKNKEKRRLGVGVEWLQIVNSFNIKEC